MKNTSFNVVAPFYDGLARLVFGKEIQKAQTHFLQQISDSESILVLGGGTGLALKEFITGTKAKITYIDSSEKMIALAERNLASAKDRIQFVCGTQDNIPAGTYDVVILNFFVDMFSDEALDIILNKIKKTLSREGQVIVTDFMKTTIFWQRVLLQSMYLFFRVTCDIPAKKLPDWISKLRDTGFHLLNRKAFYHGFIETRLYKATQ